MEHIAIKYITEIPKLELIGGKSDWIDLYCAPHDKNGVPDKDGAFIEEGAAGLIPLGVAMRLPEGYEAHLVPRSSTIKKYALIMGNSFGVIDNSYNSESDEWGFQVFCIPEKYVRGNKYIKAEYVVRNGRKGIHIPFGERICQFRIAKNQPEIVFDEVVHLVGRKRGGFGSTDKLNQGE